MRVFIFVTQTRSCVSFLIKRQCKVYTIRLLSDSKGKKYIRKIGQLTLATNVGGFYLSWKGRLIDSIEDNAFEPVSTIRVGVAFSFLFSFFSTVERVLERPHDDNREWLTLHCDFNRGSPLLLYEPSIRFTSLGTEIRHLPTFPADFYFALCDQKSQ